jgi:hypothetical protein
MPGVLSLGNTKRVAGYNPQLPATQPWRAPNLGGPQARRGDYAPASEECKFGIEPDKPFCMS